MIKEFAVLSTEEQQMLVDAIPLITLLIAGADGKVDDNELEWSKKMTDIRSYSTPDGLNKYYEMVGSQYDERMKSLMQNLSDNVATRQDEIIKMLTKLNAVMPKLEFNYAYRLYKSWTSFAEHVAKASGGFMGFATISQEEKDLLSLPMINPILP